MKYYDLVYGSFSYCSPSCRDQHLLPEYNRRLKEDLNSDKSLSIVSDHDSINSPGGTSNMVEILCIYKGKSNFFFLIGNTAKQHTITKRAPKLSDEVYYYHDKWSEGSKTGVS